MQKTGGGATKYSVELLALIVMLIALLSSQLTHADEIRVAVASNFTTAIKELSSKFEEQSEHKVKLIFGATGRHYAQIKNGAPFDLFFAADSWRPELLEKEGLVQKNCRYTYALGKLVLWSPKTGLIDQQATVLEQGNFYHIAVANPKLAPYGKAAQEVLEIRRLWKPLKAKMVRGENIGQTFQFVKSGNVALGFVALSQVKHLEDDEQGSTWNIPDSLYSPIKQQAVLLNKTPAAEEFFAFVKSDQAREIIKNFGYGLP